MFLGDYEKIVSPIILRFLGTAFRPRSSEPLQRSETGDLSDDTHLSLSSWNRGEMMECSNIGENNYYGWRKVVDSYSFPAAGDSPGITDFAL